MIKTFIKDMKLLNKMNPQYVMSFAFLQTTATLLALCLTMLHSSFLFLTLAVVPITIFIISYYAIYYEMFRDMELRARIIAKNLTLEMRYPFFKGRFNKID